ncbi:YoaK family protein [Dyadobacter sp. CY343]|uniref:YoaK family protein n=1 Tax=Dyadobacter sp. CY343 TaxID=2907299 RepID=UPI001F327DE2|nr:YoaK family protein [Dyadobacter sp. CY343]MCE7062370.1 DUF1275 domain-containing protein [Dyadobacter sp. CY343]
MLRHLGKKRSFKHNLGLATFLAFSAGFVNAAGFVAFGLLTTNVTGHTATLAIDLVSGDWHAAARVLLWLMLFLAGSFISGLLIGAVGPDKRNAYVGPIWGVILCLGLVCLFATPGASLHRQHAFAGILLFAMGMQNAVVTVISGSVVRTTHLTGIFTDLGVDLARIMVQGQSTVLWSRTLLRLSIITAFLLGGVSGAFEFRRLSFTAFLLPITILLLTLLYSRLRIGLRRTKKRISNLG